MILRPAVLDMLKRETLIGRMVLYETHRLYMKDGSLPEALIERKRVLRQLYDYFFSNFNKVKQRKFIPDFLLPMLHNLDITPSLLKQKDAIALYYLLSEPLTLNNYTTASNNLFDSNQFICFLASVSNFFIQSTKINFKTKAHLLLSRIELSSGFKSFLK
jgi:hypothetical protein